MRSISPLSGSSSRIFPNLSTSWESHQGKSCPRRPQISSGFSSGPLEAHCTFSCYRKSPHRIPFRVHSRWVLCIARMAAHVTLFARPLVVADFGHNFLAWKLVQLLLANTLKTNHSGLWNRGSHLALRCVIDRTYEDLKHGSSRRAEQSA